MNTNAIPLFRYAEVLLNYAEAKAELGTLTDADWANTVGVLRARAGITGGLSAKPTKVDAYFQQNYFPNISTRSSSKCAVSVPSNWRWKVSVSPT